MLHATLPYPSCRLPSPPSVLSSSNSSSRNYLAASSKLPAPTHKVDGGVARSDAGHFLIGDVDDGDG
nr:unnamed protein product [Digitaria exilis]